MIEGGMPVGAKDCHSNYMDYDRFFEFSKDAGFEMVGHVNDCDKGKAGAPAGTWCGKWISRDACCRVDPARAHALCPAPSFPTAGAMLAGGHHNYEVSQGSASEVRQDVLFRNGWAVAQGTQAKGVTEGCISWAGDVLHCETEFPEHALVWQWTPKNATVR